MLIAVGKRVLEIFNPLTLKMKLSLLDIAKIKKYSIFRIYNMIKCTNGMTVESLLMIDEGAALILT